MCLSKGLFYLNVLKGKYLIYLLVHRFSAASLLRKLPLPVHGFYAISNLVSAIISRRIFYDVIFFITIFKHCPHYQHSDWPPASFENARDFMDKYD